MRREKLGTTARATIIVKRGNGKIEVYRAGEKSILRKIWRAISRWWRK